MALFRKPELTTLSQEVLCHIFSYLAVKDMMSMGMTCKKLATSMNIHLRMCKKLDLCDSEVWGWMPECITDDQLYSLLAKCPKLEELYGLHPQKVESRRLRKKLALSVIGIIDALMVCPCLKKVETNSFQVLEAFFDYLPRVEVVGHFRNEDCGYPPNPAKQLKMSRYPLITSLHLKGVFVPELVYMPELKDLHLQWVRFTRFEPFKSFTAPKLRTFVINQCFASCFPFRYLQLFKALSHAPDLERMECVRLPLPGDVFQQAVAESWNERGFHKLKKLVISDCPAVLDVDVGYLMIAASRSLEYVSIPPSLMTDNFFASLQFARCDFSSLKTLHIAYLENLSVSEISNNFGFLYVHGGTSILEPLSTDRQPSAITDRGVQIMGILFPSCENLTMSHCPHLIYADGWRIEDNSWASLLQLTLHHCYCLKISPFKFFLRHLPHIEVIVLKDMFPVPPKGCSHVGLSVGTGLGLSSAVVTTRDERIAVNLPEEHIAFRIGPEPELLHFNNMNNDNNEWRRYENHVHRPIDIKIEQQERGLIPYDYELLPENSLDQNMKEENDEMDAEELGDNAEDNPFKQEEEFSEEHSRYVMVKTEPLETEDEFSEVTFPLPIIKKEPCEDPLSLPGPSKKASRKGKKFWGVEQLYRGPLTRHRRRMMLGTHLLQQNRYSQGSQTCSSFVRRNLGQEICCCSICNRTCRCCYANSTDKDYAPDRRDTQRKKVMVNQSTSTNDPIYEIDPEQHFVLECSSVKSITFISCGLSMILVQIAPELRHIEAQACPILGSIDFEKAPNIVRVNVDYCPKFKFNYFLSPDRPIRLNEPSLVYFKSHLPGIHVSEIVEKYLSGPRFGPSGMTFAVLHDYTYENVTEEDFRESNQAVYRENLLGWLRLLKQVIEFSNVKKTLRQFETCREIPTCLYDQHRIYGEFSNGSRYDLITNNPLLATLWRRNKNSIEICPTEKLSGFDNIEEVVSSLRQEIAELVEMDFSDSSKAIGFYVDVKC